MKKLNLNRDFEEVSHSIKVNAEAAAKRLYRYYTAIDDKLEKFRHKVSDLLEFKKNAAIAEEKAYEVWTACDDSMEMFRQDVTEMVSAALLTGKFLINKAGSIIAADKKFEHLVTVSFFESFEGIENLSRRIHALYDAGSVKMHHLVKIVEARIDAIIENYIENRKRWIAVASTMTCCFMMFCVTVNAGTVYNYYYHGTEIGTVKDKTEVESAVEQIKTEVPEELNVDVAVNAQPDVDITYEKQFSFSAVVDSAEDVADKLVNSDELEGNGYAIRVNGVVVALVDTEETADSIMETVRRNYCTVNSDTEEAILASASLTEDDDADAESSATTEMDAAVIRNMILAGSMNTQTGVVTAGSADETQGLDYSNIDFTAVDASSLEGVFFDNVFIDDEVSVEPVTAKVSDFSDYDTAIDYFVDDEGKSKILKVSTSEIEVYNEPVAYNTTYEETDTLYQGESYVKTQGVNGEKQIVASVTKENGEEVSRDIVNESVTTEPVDEVILQGTKEKPSWAPTGKFIVPATGRFSSGYGQRWGRLHAGIDIAGSAGSDVVAADGGTVIYAQYNNGGYGNLVKIDHGNGYVTYYAHNSSLCVSVGDKVYQGQVIAKMGSTGRSTGNHCHFEIHVNGSTVNPSQYLNM
jgi:murein DD-endopeptidase MepM/ murein hydrolase activator NlpD